MKYSIIVPVYNAEKYIKRCLESLVNQTYKNVEIIAVNDGSIDNSINILNEYAKKYLNIKVITQNNQGCVIARKNGIINSTGEYCMFVDSDDWIDINSIEIINNYLKKLKDIDIIKFRYVYEPSKRQQCKYLIENQVISEDKLKDVYYGLLLSNNYNNLCNEVFKRKLYNFTSPVINKKVNYGEDLIVNLNLFYYAKKIFLINDLLYHYFINDNSITQNITIDNIAKNINDNILTNKEKIKYIKKYNIEIDEKLIKKKSVDFVYTLIKDYVGVIKDCNFNLLQKKINETEFYDFIPKFTKKDFNEDIFYIKRMKLFIVDKKITKIKKYSFYFKFRKKIKRFLNKIK